MGYAAHYVDSAIRVAYSIIESWRRNYLRGRRGREKPVVRKKFVRVKGTLFVYKDGKLRVTIKPREYIEFEISGAWFKERVEGWSLGELILKEDEIVITFKKEREEGKGGDVIGWDSNLFSLDGFSPRYGWIRVDLSHLYHIHRVHEIKRGRAQKGASKKASLVVSKHGRRERNRARDFVHKLTTRLAREFEGVHAFERLNKRGMFTRGRRHNRDISKQNWGAIVRYMDYKSEVRPVSAKGTTSTCPMCGGGMKLRKGRVATCKRCGLTLDRQLCAAINIYLKMCGFPQH
ncbi:MAG: RNA-guided endonuclease InsQ/TnpB family protein, partial [Candidatus Methanospirareceae archaeon]